MKLTNKKMFYIAAVVVVASVIASSMIAMMTTNTSAKKPDEIEPSGESMTYVIGEHQGRVTGFVEGVEIPYVRTDTAVDSLPYEVQERIRAGIEFESEQEMRRYLDELCS